MCILKLKHVERHRPCNPLEWTGRFDGTDARRLHETIHFWKKTEMEYDEESERIAFIGFCCDEGIRRNQGRIGAASGPTSLRRELSNLPIHKKSKKIFFDLGNIVCEDGNLEESQKELGELVSLLLAQNFFPVLLGGGHEVAWGHYQGFSTAYPQKNPVIINFDAHLDMRPLIDNKGTSGTSFLQIAEDRKQKKIPIEYNCFGVQEFGNTENLFKTAELHHVNIIRAEEFHLNGLAVPLDILRRIIAQAESLYVSICLDVFASAYAPGVSAPQPLGLTPWQIIPLLQEINASGKLLGVDIAELSPPFDRDGMTARLAANLIAKLILH